MWFKTRVGYYAVSEPMEIRVAKYDKSKKPSFSIFVRSLDDPNIDYIGIIEKFKTSGRFVHLAKFLMSESSAQKIAACMKSIEEAITTEAKFCDLSGVGDEAAWDAAWTLIEW